MHLRNFLIPIYLISLASCSIIDTNKIAPGYVEAYRSIEKAVFGYEDSIDPSLIANIPYASLLLRIGKGPQGLMILERNINQDYYWISADGVYLKLNQGSIKQTTGLPNNLLEVSSNAIKWSQIKEEINLVKYYSFEEPLLRNLKLNGRMVRSGKQNVDLYNRTVRLNYFKEELHSSSIAWSFVNEYWVDEENFVWKSVQYISPKLPPIQIEVTKKPR